MKTRKPKILTNNPEGRAKASKIFHAIRDFVDYLAMRWQDEQEYEDIREYQEAIQKKLPKGARVISMTKRPFGFRFIVDETTSLFLIQVKEGRGNVATHSLSQLA